MAKFKKKNNNIDNPNFDIIQKYIKTDILEDLTAYPKSFNSIIKKNYKVNDLINLFKNYGIEDNTPELLYFFYHFHNLIQFVDYNTKSKQYNLINTFNKDLEKLEKFLNTTSPKANKITSQEDFNKLLKIKSITFVLSNGKPLTINSYGLNAQLIYGIEEQIKELKKTITHSTVKNEKTYFLNFVKEATPPFIKFLKKECGLKKYIFVFTQEFLQSITNCPSKLTSEYIEQSIKDLKKKK